MCGHERRILVDLQLGQPEILRPRANAIVTAVNQQSTITSAKPNAIYRIRTPCSLEQIYTQLFRSANRRDCFMDPQFLLEPRLPDYFLISRKLPW
jgi:hypothetical protein